MPKIGDGWEIDGIQTLTVSPGDCRAMLSGTLRQDVCRDIGCIRAFMPPGGARGKRMDAGLFNLRPFSRGCGVREAVYPGGQGKGMALRGDLMGTAAIGSCEPGGAYSRDV